MNNKMSDLLYCELYKINRKRTLMKIVIAIVVIALAMTILSSVINSIFSEVAISQGLSDYDANIAQLYYEMDMLKSDTSWIDKLIVTNAEAGYKAQIALFEYLKANNIASGSVMAYSNSSSNMLGFFGFDVFNFTTTTFDFLMLVVVIFLMVACCRTTCGEYGSGAMKMQLLRPINKNKFFTAKWLSVVIVSEALTLLCFFLCFIIGLILYGPNALNVAFVAGTVVTVLPPMGALMIILLINMVKVFAYTQVTMFICALSKTYGKAIVISLLLIALGLGVYVEYVLAVPYVGYFAFLANLDWFSGISIDCPIFKGMTIWVMIPVTLLWCAFFMWYSYRRFNKREV